MLVENEMRRTMQGDDDVAVLPAGPEHISEIVNIHLTSFPGFFLTFLGPRFLHLLYECMRFDSEGIVLIATNGGCTEGFVAGVFNQSGFYRRLIRKRKWSFALAALGGFLRRPSIAPRLIRALRRPAESESSSASACLMSIAVHPAASGKGLGRALVESFCEELTRSGVTAVCLTTDRDENTRVNLFYQQLGFVLTRTFVTPEGRAMNEYSKSLVSDAFAGLEVGIEVKAENPNRDEKVFRR